MKKKFVIAAILALGASVASAQENSASGPRPQPANAGIRADLRASATVNGPAPMKAEARIMATTSKMVPREAIDARMSNIETRVEKGMQKLEEKKDRIASTTEAKLQDMRAKLETKSAQIEGRASSTKTRVEEAREKLEGRIERRASSTEARLEARQEKIEVRLAASTKNASDKAAQVVERLTDIKGKIEARIDKIEEAGTDVANARQALVTATVKIDAADASVKALAEITIDNSNPQASLEAFKTALATTHATIRDAQASLNAVVQILKSSAQE